MQHRVTPNSSAQSILPGGIARRVRYVALRTVPAPILRAIEPRDGLLEEIEKLPIVDAGVESEGTPFIALQDDLRVVGYASLSADVFQYRRLRRSKRRVLPEACFRLAVDVVCRYLYPHALGTLTPPYPLSARAKFHPQHWDTIADLPNRSADEKRAMTQRFGLDPGDVVLDIGAFIGLGALRISRLVGSEGRVLSVETDEHHAALFERNMNANDVKNVSLIRRAIWSGPGEMQLQQQGLQANSLVEGIVDAKGAITVQTECIDNLVRNAELDKVTLVSLTINGAEIEAIEGMDATLKKFKPNLTVAGWYERDGRPIHEFVTRRLADYNYETVVAPGGRVYAWSSEI